MIHSFKRAWEGMVLPLLRRPNRVQVAALCYRDGDAGREVLLITSRDTGRWIVPKGWPIDGLDGSGAALHEAWEEAGVAEADVQPTHIGTYEYEKNLIEGMSVPVETRVYLARVSDLAKQYPEAGERKRKWFSPQEAAKLVDEPDLKALIASI